MTILESANTVKAFDVSIINGGQLLTQTQEGYTLIPEHPMNPATFVATFDTNWIIPNKYHISTLVVVVYTFGNNNKPPTLEDMLDLTRKAVIETNRLIDIERQNKNIDIDKIEIVPLNEAKTILTLQDCLTRAYPVN